MMTKKIVWFFNLAWISNFILHRGNLRLRAPSIDVYPVPNCKGTLRLVLCHMANEVTSSSRMEEGCISSADSPLSSPWSLKVFWGVTKNCWIAWSAGGKYSLTCGTEDQQHLIIPELSEDSFENCRSEQLTWGGGGVSNPPYGSSYLVWFDSLVTICFRPPQWNLSNRLIVIESVNGKAGLSTFLLQIAWSCRELRGKKGE